MPNASPPDARFSEIQCAKQEIRRRVLTLREGLPDDVRAARSRLIVQRIAALPSFAAARTVLLFYHFGSEWASAWLAHEALQSGKIVALPRVLRSSENSRQLALQTVENIDRDTTPGMLGIREPLPERPAVAPEAIDWVLVPGVAFTPHGDRLGYGAGLYDRLLPQIPAYAPRVAGAFDVQIVDEIPTDRHDFPVDAIYTESRVFHCIRGV